MAFAANCILLLHYTSRLAAVAVIRRASAAIAGAIVLVVAAMLGLWAVGAHPTPQFGNLLFSTFFTAVVLAMANMGAAMFRLAADFVTAFHVKYNAANLHRFPISVLTEHRRALDRFAALVWCVGSGPMFYGVWFDMRV